MTTQTPASITPGTVLASKYRVERVLGQGGMGVVVEARHIALDERIALKFLLPEYAQHPEASQRFLREARAAVKIKTEHVARVSDVGQLETGAPYMVMEFLQGEDLSKTLETRGTLSIQDALDFVIQGCEAIAEAHSYGIVHRDIKPANLFLARRPDGSPIVKVLDFGISKVMGGGVENLTKTMAAMGSALYMSPEQMRQTKSVDHRTDIYALGISLYELLAGKQPFYADTLPQLCAEILTGTPTPIRTARPDVPEALAAVIERAYARDLEHRYQSVAEFVNALAPFAPTRVQPNVDRIARLAGIPAAQAGRAPTSQPPPAPMPGGTQVVPGGIHPGTDPNQIRLAPYAAPHSTRAANAFAAGASTSPGLSNTKPGTKPSSGPVVAVVLGLAVLGGVAGAYFLFGRKSPQGTTASAETAHAQPTQEGAPPKAPSVTVTPTADTVAPIADPPKTADVATAPPTAAPTTAPTAPGGHGRTPPVAKTTVAIAQPPPPPPPTQTPAAPPPKPPPAAPQNPTGFDPSNPH